ncbi:MAG: hypothetical protein KJ710_01115 [Candidatus Omnitrophica bacterium]|nr:hypothetical protein [Candidatus Omnitrophota bacterium]MBU1922850.1 hypothetical protein [Candidatus Omnitrophota bacterium]
MFRNLSRIILCTILFFICVSFNRLIFSAEPDIPLPEGALKTMEKSMDVGPSKSTIQFYETSLNNNKIASFYRKEMLRLGWREQRTGFFLKDNYLAVIVSNPRKSKGEKTQFSITISRIPGKEEILAGRKDTPDKLSFMPVYPKSAQVFLWDMPTGVSASYETDSSIKELVFFYKSGMLNYGWSLDKEAPITTETADCPECQKAKQNLPKDSSLPDMKVTSSRGNLLFSRQNGERCTIKLYQNISDIQEVNKTTILVTYNANKKIN